MKEKTFQILHFKEMNTLYEYINVSVCTQNPNLHIYKFSDFTQDSLKVMKPHSKDFHQVSFITGFGDSQLNINQSKVQKVNAVLYFISPQHIYSWVRDPKIEGFILNFKQSLLPFKPAEFQERFRYFNLDELNAIPISQDQIERVIELFNDLYKEYNEPRTAFSQEILQHYLLALLYKCLNLFDSRTEEMHKSQTNDGIFYKFQNLINNYYLTKRSVKEYSELLHITPNHLSETIKKSTGQNALHFINERLLLEAKNLLVYGIDDIKGIAYMLNFASPSHFGKFFKKHTGQTPLQYREQYTSKK